MSPKVVVLGSGYAGTGAVASLQSALSDDASLTWISDVDYHLVLHESHRAIREPAVADHITIPMGDIADPGTAVLEATVTGVDVDAREVELADHDPVAYDYLLVALGSGTAFYGIPGLGEHALTLKSLKDARAIHDAVATAAERATPDDPARVIVGGAGLSGIQAAGEVAGFRDDHDAALEVVLVEALEEILPGHPSTLQRRLRRMLEDAAVAVRTDDPITEATADAVTFDGGEDLPYDVLVWTGGITGREALDGVALENEHNRLTAGADFRTEDDRVFAIGDAAVVDQGDEPAPPTAQAAWQAAAVAGENVARAIRGEPLETWTYEDKGTLISVGHRAIAHDVVGVPIGTFGSLPARFLKKFVAARWIASVTSWRRALRAWRYL